MLNEEDRYLSYPEVEEYTGLSHDTVRRAARSGRLKHSGYRKGTRFLKSDVDKWMETRR